MTGRLVSEAKNGKQTAIMLRTMQKWLVSRWARYFVSIQRHSLMEVPPHRGKEPATASHLNAAACFTALADLRAHHHPAFVCLVEVPLDREAGFILSMEKQNFVKPKHWGFWLGMLWLISDSMKSVLRRMPQRHRTDSAFSYL